MLKVLLALLLVGGTATAVVAPAADMAGARQADRAANAASAASAPLAHSTPAPTPEATPDQSNTSRPSAEPKPDFEALLRRCLETRDPDSDACGDARSASGTSAEDFRAKIVAKLATPKPEPTAKPISFEALLRACLETRDPASKACTRAGEASGLSPADWAAKLVTKLAAAQQSDFAAYFEKCLGTRDVTSDVCRRAAQLSGLSPAEFEAKLRAKLAAKEGGDFWTWFEKCLATRDVRSDACAKAQALIGLGDADFQAKFARFLAERDAAAHKASPTPKPAPKPAPTVWSAYLELLVKDCLAKSAVAVGSPESTAAVTAAGEACQKAITASGLSPNDFWARLGPITPTK